MKITKRNADKTANQNRPRRFILEHVSNCKSDETE